MEPKRQRPRKAGGKVAAIFFFFACAAAAFAQSTTNPVFAARAEKAFRLAQIQFAQATNDAAAWQFARACFDFADFATNDTQRAVIARQGIAVSRVDPQGSAVTLFGLRQPASANQFLGRITLLLSQ